MFKDFINNPVEATHYVIANNPNFLNYHMNRIAFGELPSGEVIFKYNETRCHFEWMRDDYNVTSEEFERLIRGNIHDNKIHFYMGNIHGPVGDKPKLKNIIERYYDIFKPHTKDRKIFNGLRVGELGTLWDPMYELKFFK